MTLQRCTACGAFQYPPREVCATCLSDRLDGDPSADTHGEVLARTLLHHSFEPRFRAQLPIAVGLVRFDAGPVAVCFLGPATGARLPRADPRTARRNGPSGAGGIVVTDRPASRWSPAAAPESGLAICRQMLNAGYEVVSLDRDPAPLPHARLYPLQVILAMRRQRAGGA